MKALVYTGIGQLEIQDVPMPEDDFIIKVSGCGVCGTDLKTYIVGHHMFKPPAILGHEFYGTVYRAPQNCGFKEGDVVVAVPYRECGECLTCRRTVGQMCRNKSFIPSGAFCEYVGVPSDYINKGIFKIEKGDDVFTLVEPLACVINGAEHLKITGFSNIAIVGSGPMGALFALLFSSRGLPVSVIETSETRRNLVSSWGIKCYEPGQVDIEDFDNIVIAVNKAEIVNEYITRVADGGTVLVFAGLPRDVVLNTDSYSVHYREVTVTGSSGFSIQHFKKALEMIKTNPGMFSRVITHRLPLEQGREGFELLKKAEPLKMVLKP
jgi:L-iditol 2-dehydrogenase